MRENRWIASAVSALALVIGSSEVDAQTATQVVRFSVMPSSRVSLNAPTSASTGGSSYAISTNEINQKIAVAVDKPMPAGVSLSVSLGAPRGAVTAGSRPLGAAARDLVTGISATSAAALPITYTLSGSSSSPVDSSARTVMFTIVAGQ